MSTTYAGPLRLIGGRLDELAAISPEFRTTGEKQDFLVEVSRLIARAEAERLRVLAAAGDIAVETGARSTAAWLADETRDAHGTVRRHAAAHITHGKAAHQGDMEERTRYPRPSHPVQDSVLASAERQRHTGMAVSLDHPARRHPDAPRVT